MEKQSFVEWFQLFNQPLLRARVHFLKNATHQARTELRVYCLGGDFGHMLSCGVIESPDKLASTLRLEKIGRDQLLKRVAKMSSENGWWANRKAEVIVTKYFDHKSAADLDESSAGTLLGAARLCIPACSLDKNLLKFMTRWEQWLEVQYMSMMGLLR